MGCEFEERETTICLPNGLGCLVDAPMGYMACTRRTWLLLQGAPTPGPTKARAWRGKVSEQQLRLV